MIDFLCIGAQKAGTTWLDANLKAHPDIWCPPFIKELHYFDVVHMNEKQTNYHELYRRRSLALIKDSPELGDYARKLADPGFVFTDDWYQHIFSIAPPGKIKGDNTPIYCALNEEGISHVHRLLPDVRIIYMVRDPYERAMSSFRMAMVRRKINEGEALAHLLKNKMFIRKGNYKANIQRWESVFDPQQILYIPFGWIKSQPERIMHDVERHLNLAPFSGYPKLHEAVHTTKIEGKVIGAEIKKEIKSMVKPQYPFLLKRFGEEFVASIK